MDTLDIGHAVLLTHYVQLSYGRVDAIQQQPAVVHSAHRCGLGSPRPVIYEPGLRQCISNGDLSIKYNLRDALFRYMLIPLRQLDNFAACHIREYDADSFGECP